MVNLELQYIEQEKTYHGNDIHGEWEELENNRDTIAHEKFKGDIIRGRNPIDALVDFGISSRIENMLRENIYE